MQYTEQPLVLTIHWIYQNLPVCLRMFRTDPVVRRGCLRSNHRRKTKHYMLNLFELLNKLDLLIKTSAFEIIMCMRQITYHTINSNAKGNRAFSIIVWYYWELLRIEGLIYWEELAELEDHVLQGMRTTEVYQQPKKKKRLVHAMSINRLGLKSKNVSRAEWIAKGRVRRN